MSIPKFPYSHEKFVDRDKALEIVLEKAHRIADKLPVERRVVIFHGQRGSGKSWLLQELEFRLDDDVAPCLIVLNENTTIDTIRSRIPEQRPLALLVDNVNEVDERLLEALEEQVLASLVQESDVLIVLAERGRPHYWTTPDFREKSDEFDLPPFKPDDVKEQIKEQVPGVEEYAEKIESYSGGYPGSTYILASLFPDIVTALDYCINSFLGDMGDEKDLRLCSEALSILRAFDETRMRPILRAYSPEFAKQSWNYATCRKIRENLMATTLVRWDGDARGYVLDEPLRLVLEAALYTRDPKLWERLHCAAYRLYEEWTEKYEQSSEWWAQEAQYHANRLKLAKLDPANCLKEQIQKEGENDN